MEHRSTLLPAHPRFFPNSLESYQESGNDWQYGGSPERRLLLESARRLLTMLVDAAAFDSNVADDDNNDSDTGEG
jgi:hypothetical protein